MLVVPKTKRTDRYDLTAKLLIDTVLFFEKNMVWEHPDSPSLSGRNRIRGEKE